MDRLSLGTDGKSAVAKNAEELMAIFLQVFDQAVPQEELPFEGNRFVTDSSIEEFTALIFRQSPETTIIAPDKQEYLHQSNDPTVSCGYRTDQYDLVTIKQPLEGEWRVIAEIEPQSRITVVSDLNLVVSPMKTDLNVGSMIDLSFALKEDNQVVTRPEFLALLSVDVTVNHLEQKQQWPRRLSTVPKDGIYQLDLDDFQTVGQYQVTIKVDGKSFQRQFSHTLHVREPFSVKMQPVTIEGKTHIQVTVSPQLSTIDLQKQKGKRKFDCAFG